MGGWFLTVWILDSWMTDSLLCSFHLQKVLHHYSVLYLLCVYSNSCFLVFVQFQVFYLYCSLRLFKPYLLNHPLTTSQAPVILAQTVTNKLAINNSSSKPSETPLLAQIQLPPSLTKYFFPSTKFHGDTKGVTTTPPPNPKKKHPKQCQNTLTWVQNLQKPPY